MIYYKQKKIIFIGSNQNLLKILGKENQTEVISSVSFLQNLIENFTPDLIIFDNVKTADIEAVRENEKLLSVPVLIVSSDFSELNNLNNITIFPRTIICNECVSCTQKFIEHLYKIMEHKKNILPSKTGALVKYAILYMNKNLSSKIKRKTFSVQLGLSEDYLTKIFKAELGLGLWEYLNIFRLDKAKKLLIKTDLSVSKISSMCGFESASYFNKAFKKFYKANPLSFRT